MIRPKNSAEYSSGLSGRITFLVKTRFRQKCRNTCNFDHIFWLHKVQKIWPRQALWMWKYVIFCRNKWKNSIVLAYTWVFCLREDPFGRIFYFWWYSVFEISLFWYLVFQWKICFGQTVSAIWLESSPNATVESWDISVSLGNWSTNLVHSGLSLSKDTHVVPSLSVHLYSSCHVTPLGSDWILFVSKRWIVCVKHGWRLKNVGAFLIPSGDAHIIQEESSQEYLNCTNWFSHWYWTIFTLQLNRMVPSLESVPGI